MTTTVKYTRNFYTRDTFLYTIPFYNLEGIAIPSYDYPLRSRVPGGVQTRSQRADLADQPTVQMRDAGRSKEQTCRAFRQKGTA